MTSIQRAIAKTVESSHDTKTRRKVTNKGSPPSSDPQLKSLIFLIAALTSIQHAIAEAVESSHHTKTTGKVPKKSSPLSSYPQLKSLIFVIVALTSIQHAIAEAVEFSHDSKTRGKVTKIKLTSKFLSKVEKFDLPYSCVDFYPASNCKNR